jgi:hypothetical protein
VRSELFPEDLAREDIWVDSKGLIHYRKVVNHAPTINENMDRKKDPQRGFTPDRCFQHIARVPPEVFHRWARRIGYYEMDQAQKKVAKYRFLRENPQWLTVEKTVNHGPNDKYVIVK